MLTPLTQASPESTSTPAQDSTQNLQSLPQKNLEALHKNLEDVEASKDDKLQKTLSEILDHFAMIDAKLVSLNEKLDATRKSLDLLTSQQQAAPSPIVGVLAPVTSGVGTPVQPPASSQDPDFGLVNDTAVQNYREALLLYHAQKYPEATLAFSKFIDDNPDHPLSGSAQYYIGDSYLKQNEYRLAIQEFKRVLTSYGHSIHISDTLLGLALAEDALKDSSSAENHKHLLFSLFPQSPAAAVPLVKNQTLPTTPSLAESTTTPPTASIESLPPPTQSTEKPVEKPMDKPAEESMQKPTDMAADTPTGTRTDIPTDIR